MTNSNHTDKLVHAKSHPVVRINSKRFEQSPYAEKYIRENTLFGCYCNRFYPISLGGDVVEQYWKLRREVLLFDVPEKPLDIKGPDAVALLERVFSRNIGNLKTGRANYAIACTPQGGIQMDGVMIRLAEDHFWYVQANGEFESWLTAFSDGLDVAVSDPRSRVLQVQGPKSLDVLHAATGGQIPENFGYFHAGTFNFAGQAMLVTRTGWTGELGFEVYSNKTTDHLALWDHLIESGKPFGMLNAGLEVMGMRRVEAGILDYGTDIDKSMTPFDIGLGNFVNFDKPDFIGREALQKANKGQRLYGIRCATGVPRVGYEVLDGDQIVGVVKVGDWSPTLKLGIAYVLFAEHKTEQDSWLGKTLNLRGAPGEASAGERFEGVVVSLPFYDAQKKIPRGLEVADV
ncbi:MAG: aminomethyl transferase family protein [Proteobacteria bacterium]|nr:aminomethyl transferase family protein [Pseudomonadota bacterium]